MNIADEKYVSFTTYKKDGTPKSTPVWIVDVGDSKVGFTTDSSSWKVKRLTNNPQVMLQPSNMKGDVTPGTTAVEGTATFVQGAEADRIQGLIKKKYSPGYYLIMAMYWVQGLFGNKTNSDGAVVVTLS